MSIPPELADSVGGTISQATELGEQGELNIKMLGPSAGWLRELFGSAMLSEVAEIAGIEPSAFEGGQVWLSLEQVEAFLQQVFVHCAEDEPAFLKACAHAPLAGYGPILYLLRASSVGTSCRAVARTMPFVSRISRYQFEARGPGRVALHYRSDRQESHLMCLSRRAMFEALPETLGIGRPLVSHPRCLARGDDRCEYRLTFEERHAWPRIVTTAMGVGLASLALQQLLGLPWLAPVLAAGASSLVAWGVALRRRERAASAVNRELQRALAQQVTDNLEAHEEILALQQRQQTWGEVVEEQVRDRTSALERVVEGLRSMQVKRETKLRGVTHDLRNPLSVLMSSGELLQMDPPSRIDIPAIGADIFEASQRMERILTELMEVAVLEAEQAGRVPSTLSTEGLDQSLGRRLRALTLGRDIQVSVLHTREAPSEIQVDLLIFDRILDNLFSNAAKYTARGSILLKIGGRPGYLVLKLSDTGRGIADDAIEKVFEATGSAEASRAPSSFGVGLSVVVQLLHEAGGQLEVMSRPGQGTTFWVHLPIEPPQQQPSTSDGSLELAQVLHIRKVQA